MELSKRVYDICDSEEDPSVELKAFLDAHPHVSVDQYRGEYGRQALHSASKRGHAACVRMLLVHGADVDAGDATDEKALAYTSMWNQLECMEILIEAKANVNATNNADLNAVWFASNGKTACLQLLIDNRADVNARGWTGYTPAMNACTVQPHKRGSHLPCLQLLVDNKADLSVRDDDNRDALYFAIQGYDFQQAVSFSVLACDTDAKNVHIDEIDDDDDEGGEEEDDENDGFTVTAAGLAVCIEEYKCIQAYIDEFHRILKDTLSTKVDVDVRVGRGGRGIYQEPMERALEYMGLSMKKDQVVNASIDGADGIIKRALIPFHVLSAAMWRGKYRSHR
jgi:hypothetical protein